MNEIEKGTELHTLLEIIIRAKVNVVANYLVIGETLNKLNESDLWKSAGSHISTFHEFLKEIRIGRSTAYNCMGIAEKFGEFIKDKKLDADYTRLVALLPIAMEDTKEEWLLKAQELPADAFDDEIREAKGKLPRGQCTHENVESWGKCSECGKFLQYEKSRG